MCTNVQINWLLDFYGGMLTDRQRNTLELHYGDDLSLSEIADTLDITRQAVHDSLKRGEKLLCMYEEKLKLVDRYLSVSTKIESITLMSQELKGESKHKKLYDEIKKLQEMWD